MIPILIAGPAVEPVTLAEMRAHLRRDDDREDALIAGLIKAARLTVEAAARRILTESRWQIWLDHWPRSRVIILPLAPLLAIDRIRIFAVDDEPTDLPPTAYAGEPTCDPPRIRIAPEAPAPGRSSRGIAIELRAGYGAGAEAVPEPLRLAVKMMAARWFEHRGDDPMPEGLPADAQALVEPYRRIRL